MKLLEIMQGKWLGHPLHPALVHIPVGAWFAACVIDAVTWAGWTHGGPGRLAMYAVAIGLVGAFLAVPAGVADWTPIKHEKPAWKLGLYHMILNLLAALVWALNFGLRMNTSETITAPILVTSIIGTLLVLVSGYLGSLMVFDQGTGIARDSKKKWRAIATRGGANLPEEK